MLLSPSGVEESGDSDQSSRSPQGFPASLQLHPSPTLARQVSDEMWYSDKDFIEIRICCIAYSYSFDDM